MSDPFAIQRIRQARAELIEALLDRPIAKLSLALKLWNPDQPRVPAGTTDGGQQAGGNGRFSRIAENLTNSRTQSAASSTAPKAVPFVDRAGHAILDKGGQPMLRPDTLPPEYFAERGRQAAQRIHDARNVSDPLAPDVAHELSILGSDLAKFRQGGEWDAQRVGGTFHDEFRDYATVAIGIYGASAGIPQNTILGLQSLYAAAFSRFRPDEPMDDFYGSLPVKNVFNTALGYALVAGGRIGARRDR